MSSGRPARRSRSAVRRRTDSTVPPKMMKPADAEIERIGDAGGLMREAAVGGGAKRRQDQPAGIGRGGGRASWRRDRAEDAGAARAGRGGNVAGLPVQREVAEQRERDRLLGVAREEQLVEPAERMAARRRELPLERRP